MNLIVGRKPVLEAIKSGEELEKIYLLYGQKGDIIFEIKKLSRQHKIHLTELPANKFKRIASDVRSQGVVALKSIQKYYSIDEIIDEAKKSLYPTILILDSIQDPHNLGAILRTAECAGVDKILITIHESAVINETVVKTSAGATEHLMIAKVSNLSQSLDLLREKGFWIMGTSLNDSRDYRNIDYKIPMVIIMGNEERGIRSIISKKCDFLIKIPILGKLQSLNVSVASGIILYEVLKQREI
jgi:23S rRNA (guanosine2251-2'-O)-methyltransferase